MRVLIEIEQDPFECHPFTVDAPTALLRVLDQSILEHNLDILAAAKVAEVTVAAGQWRDHIAALIGERYRGIQIDYAGELDDCSHLSGAFVMRGNALYSAELATALGSGGVEDCDRGVASAVRYPWNLLEANVDRLRQTIEDQRLGQIEEGAFIKGAVHIEEGALIKFGSYIEGPAFIGRNTKIGPFAHIRPDTIIERDCEIGKAELYDCLIMRGTTCKHQAYIGHSVVGQAVNIGAGLITADYRHDSAEHTTIVAGQKVETGRRKLGTFIGDDVHTGIGTLIYPGRKIWPGRATLPGEIVSQDKR